MVRASNESVSFGEACGVYELLDVLLVLFRTYHQHVFGVDDDEFVESLHHGEFPLRFFDEASVRVEQDAVRTFGIAVGILGKVFVKRTPCADVAPAEIAAAHIDVVRHILITGDGDESKAQIEKLQAEIQNGASFEELAKAHSQDPGSGSKGGDLGFFAEGRMVPEFDAALKDMKQPGEVGAPVKTQFGWHLIQLVERRPGGKRPYEEVREELHREARTRILSEKRLAKSTALLEGASYQEDAIKAFVEKTE